MTNETITGAEENEKEKVLPEESGRRDRLASWLSLIFRVLLSGLFIYSAWHKLLDPLSFLVKVNEYEVLPPSWEEPFARALPWVMLLSSLFLLAGLFTRAAAAAQALMLISFIVAISINIYRDRVMGCGCFSEEGHQIGPLLLVQDFFLLGLAGWLVFRGGGSFSLERFLFKKKA